MKLLLHACCGPCLIEPARILTSELSEDDGFAVYYANSNIHPYEEYVRRRDACREYTEAHGWEFIEGAYDPDVWTQTIADELVAPRRCNLCYRVRFKEAVRAADRWGYDTVSTTLSVSPYQGQQAIKEELERAAALVNVRPLYRDFSEQFSEATRVSRELGIYRQNYCGCSYSEDEAKKQRAERKAARALRKQT